MCNHRILNRKLGPDSPLYLQGLSQDARSSCNPTVIIRINVTQVFRDGLKFNSNKMRECWLAVCPPPVFCKTTYLLQGRYRCEHQNPAEEQQAPRHKHKWFRTECNHLYILPNCAILGYKFSFAIVG